MLHADAVAFGMPAEAVARHTPFAADAAAHVDGCSQERLAALVAAVESPAVVVYRSDLFAACSAFAVYADVMRNLACAA